LEHSVNALQQGNMYLIGDHRQRI